MVATLSPPSASVKTYEDYAQLPEGAPYQLVDGEIIEMTAPTILHQKCALNLVIALKGLVSKQNLGEILFAPVDVYLSETNTPQPDIIFIAKENLDIIGEQKIEGAPDLVVEILSPSTAYLDLKSKKRIYEEFGVQEYWIVDPIEKSVEVFASTAGQFQLFQRAVEKETLHSQLLPEFALETATIFA